MSSFGLEYFLFSPPPLFLLVVLDVPGSPCDHPVRSDQPLFLFRLVNAERPWRAPPTLMVHCGRLSPSRGMDHGVVRSPNSHPDALEIFLSEAQNLLTSDRSSSAPEWDPNPFQGVLQSSPENPPTPSFVVSGLVVQALVVLANQVPEPPLDDLVQRVQESQDPDDENDDLSGGRVPDVLGDAFDGALKVSFDLSKKRPLLFFRLPLGVQPVHHLVDLLQDLLLHGLGRILSQVV